MSEKPTRTFQSGADGAAPVAIPQLVLALECARPLAKPVRFSLAGLGEVRFGRAAERAWQRVQDGAAGRLQIGVADEWASTAHFRLRAQDGGWILEDAGSKNGTFLDGARVDSAGLTDGAVIGAGGTVLVYREAGEAAAAAVVSIEESPAMFATLAPALERQLRLATRLAPTAVPILLAGETGTGKEVAARAIHARSGRTGPFVAVNCGAIPVNLIESELFGARKGAFSGAGEDRPGLIRASHGGTLFLDEIAELPEPCQIALLRVLQEREVLPLGATRPVPVDLRVVAATHASLERLVAAGSFRQDLFGRIMGQRITLPPLRERCEDLGLLIAELLPRVAGARAARLRLHRNVAWALFAHGWPQNVRELEQTLAAAVAVADGDEIGPADLPEAVRAPAVAAPAPGTDRTMESLPPEELAERTRILAALDDNAGNQTRAAAALGMSRSNLTAKLRLYRIPRPRRP